MFPKQPAIGAIPGLIFANANKVLVSKSIKIVVKVIHEKRTDGWALPRGDPIEKVFLEELSSQMKGFYEACLLGRRRSDTQPLSDHSGDDSNSEDDFIPRLT